ncbi:MAG: SurA N-terminal domain-containing protein [Rhizobiaceae bacterium]
MLTALRNSASGIVAKIFLGLLVISFAVWGVSGAFIGGAGNSTVDFGKTSVSLADYRLAWNSRLNAVQQQLGQRITRDQARAFGLEQSVNGQIVAGAVLDENARLMGLGVTEDRLAQLIADDPAFKDQSGRFSKTRLTFALREIGMREEDYVRNRQAVAVRRQFLDAIGGGLSSSQAFSDLYATYQAEERGLDYVEITDKALSAVPSPGDADIEKHFEENKTSYMAPEYRKLILVRLAAEDISKPDAIPADEVEADYEKNKTRYTTEEVRAVQQIVFPDKAAADAAAAKLGEGTTFEALLSELGRKPEDVDLGKVNRKQIPDKTIADAAFELALNTPSGVVEGIFGPVILRVTEIAPEAVKPLGEVEQQIRSALALEKAAEEIFDTHDRLEDERASGATLSEAAQKIGLTVRTLDAVDKSGNAPDGTAVADIPEQAKLLSEAFQTDEGVEADPVQLGTSGFVWFEVAGITPERQKELSEVRDAVSASWVEGEIARLVGELAEKIRERVAKGETLAAVTAELLPASEDGTPASVTSAAPIARTATTGSLTRDAVSAAFSVPQGSVLVANVQAPSKAVISVREVKAGNKQTIAPELVKQLDEALGDDLLNALVADFQSRGELHINQRAIEQALAF